MSSNAPLSNENYPGLYQAADAEAIRSQSVHFRLLLLYLCLLITGAIVTLFSGASKSYAILAAVCFLASLFSFILKTVKVYDRTWYSARAVAESVKTRAWRYMMRSRPYEGPEGDSKKAFLSDLRQILEQNRGVTKELYHKSSTRDAITSRMTEVRSLSWKERAAFYKLYRIEDQCKWYGQKAKLNKILVGRWFILTVVLYAFAIFFVLLRIAYPECERMPVEVFAVGAASAISWIQAKRFSELYASYSLAANEITIIHSQADSISSEGQFAEFVNDTENAFSREHTQWVARRDAWS